jgi:hypothetical protein
MIGIGGNVKFAKLVAGGGLAGLNVGDEEL